MGVRYTGNRTQMTSKPADSVRKPTGAWPIHQDPCAEAPKLEQPSEPRLHEWDDDVDGAPVRRSNASSNAVL